MMNKVGPWQAWIAAVPVLGSVVVAYIQLDRPIVENLALMFGVSAAVLLWLYIQMMQRHEQCEARVTGQNKRLYTVAAVMAADRRGTYRQAGEAILALATDDERKDAQAVAAMFASRQMKDGEG